jgi:hypothetical protein
MVDRMKTKEAQLFQMNKRKTSACLFQTIGAGLSLETTLKVLDLDPVKTACLPVEIHEPFTVAITDSEIPCKRGRKVPRIMLSGHVASSHEASNFVA